MTDLQKQIEALKTNATIAVTPFETAEKVGVSFGDIKINLTKCSLEECFWLIDQKHLFWRSYEMWAVLARINFLKIREYYAANPIDGQIKQALSYIIPHNTDIDVENSWRLRREVKGQYQLVPPCEIRVASKSAAYKEGEANPFWLSSSQLKQLYKEYVYLGQYGSREFAIPEFGVCSTGLFGVKFEGERNAHYTDSSRWLKCPFQISNVSSPENGEFKSRDKAILFGYAAFCEQVQLHIGTGSYPLEYIVNAIKGAYVCDGIDFTAHIQDNSYNTVRYGGVCSFSGSKVFNLAHRKSGATHAFEVYGTSPRGNAHIVSKEGGIYIKRV